MSIESVMPSNHFILCHPLLLLPSIFPSIRVFSSESAFHIRWPKYWGFRFSPSNEYSGLISFRIDWFDLLAVQGTLSNLSPFFSHPVLQNPVYFLFLASQSLLHPLYPSSQCWNHSFLHHQWPTFHQVSWVDIFQSSSASRMPWTILSPFSPWNCLLPV